MANLTFQDGFVQIINGRSSLTSQTRHGLNPATLQPKAEVPVASRDDLDRAVAAAKEAFKTWSKTPYKERRSAVLAYADAIDAFRPEFRDLLVAEQGKPVRPPHSSRVNRLVMRVIVNQSPSWPKQTSRLMQPSVGYAVWLDSTSLKMLLKRMKPAP
jgi:hypothetical protein